jgi:rubredoxin
MYKCQLCGRDSQANEPAVKLITEKRWKTYYNQYGHSIGTGWEIAKELSVCPLCYADKQKLRDTVKAQTLDRIERETQVLRSANFDEKIVNAQLADMVLSS